MDNQILTLVNQTLTKFKPQQIKAVLGLMDEGNTVPFIARYRKERTGNLDEVEIREIKDNYDRLASLESRKADVMKLIAEQDHLTPALKQAIEKADKLQDVEDLYLPYKQKRRTKATIAKDAGLEPLAAWLLRFSGKWYSGTRGAVCERSAGHHRREYRVSWSSRNLG